ncbi:hypothetical protein HZP84_15225 [Elizabethkingia anophelis]|uniref:Uncharacterized protein n=1 Tax=Elizabethkingia anophelis TaxID=1117645 RepID=A0A7Z7PWF4_9FLAO|nr:MULTISPECIES: hypothetical protein [Elizabethkingia]AQW90871.1 hypothetical protein BBD28_09450 [Elizabethkingia anophelis]AVF47694.1 hypothetical protein AL491_06170 [Elizabethkingia anophelis]AVF51686.1 hypothetical protein AL492_08580 [Elizabethkingia anophelis]EJC8059294.1 hypothetical protein [Elizabethkingia anophelis]EQB91107.1 hypothetical protein C874_13415 [Elizabethkingia anophelis 502]
MTDLELLHFEQLKSEVQAKYLENHTPSYDEISKWKGIDIIYFQEDLRKNAKGNISEKSFYTYFKTSPTTKLPRIDMLNILSIYAGYSSWYDFKKNHAFAEELLLENEHALSETKEAPLEVPIEEEYNTPDIVERQNTPVVQPQNTLPEVNTSNKTVATKPIISKVKKYLWIGISAVLAIFVAALTFADNFFTKTYTFKFVDADRSQPVQNEVEIKVLKEGESPLTYRVKPNEAFVYPTKDKTLKMVISSVFYRTENITRNLENAPETEVIQLKPNEYNMMLYSYSRSKDFKSRRAQLENLISNDAVIYQVFDNQYFNVETMSKQRYINFLSLPTTSLENLDVIETQITNGKIVLIKFRIRNNEKSL